MKYKINIIFICLIVMPILTSWVLPLLGVSNLVNIQGHFDKVEFPAYQTQSILSKDFQNQFSKWFENQLEIRKIFIKTYNQIKYSLFDVSFLIIGKNKELIEIPYAYDYCNLGAYQQTEQRDEAIRQYVQTLADVQQKLLQHNKYFLLYITPSKLSYNAQNLPQSYALRKSPDEQRAVDVFRQALKESNINYLDSKDIISTNDVYPIFYTTGIHWSRPAEQQCSIALINKLSEISGKHFHNNRLGELKSSNTPFWRDADVFNLLNIWHGKMDPTYYEYEVQPDNIAGSSDKYDQLRLLIQGGSFSEGLHRDHFADYPDDKRWYINYNNAVFDYDEHVFANIKKDWHNLDLQQYLDDTDCIVIEINECVVIGQSDGFAAYLDNFLSSYSSEA